MEEVAEKGRGRKKEKWNSILSRRKMQSMQLLLQETQRDGKMKGKLAISGIRGEVILNNEITKGRIIARMFLLLLVVVRCLLLQLP